MKMSIVFTIVPNDFLQTSVFRFSPQNDKNTFCQLRAALHRRNEVLKKKDKVVSSLFASFLGEYLKKSALHRQKKAKKKEINNNLIYSTILIYSSCIFRIVYEL
jgi:hypothetical protein